MTREIEGGLLIEPQPGEHCEMCHRFAETRPYGPRGERVCFECGMKDPKSAERQFARRLGITTN